MSEPCIWYGMKEMDTHSSHNGKNICIDCEEKALEKMEEN